MAEHIGGPQAATDDTTQDRARPPRHPPHRRRARKSRTRPRRERGQPAVVAVAPCLWTRHPTAAAAATTHTRDDTVPTRKRELPRSSSRGSRQRARGPVFGTAAAAAAAPSQCDAAHTHQHAEGLREHRAVLRRAGELPRRHGYKIMKTTVTKFEGASMPYFPRYEPVTPLRAASIGGASVPLHIHGSSPPRRRRPRAADRW